MQIHSVKVKTKMRKKKRVGRGGNYGTYARRGRDGQLSRSGGNKGLTLKVGRKGGYFKSIPMLGGFRSIGKSTIPVNISRLSQHIDKMGKVIDIKTLIKFGLVPAKTKSVKILGDKKKSKSKTRKIIKKEVKFSSDILLSKSVKDLLNIVDKKPIKSKGQTT